MANLLSLSAALTRDDPDEEEEKQEATKPQPCSGTFYTPEQRLLLENYYNVNILTNNHSFMTRKDVQKSLEELAKETNLTTDQIRMWLRNRKKRGTYKGKKVHAAMQIRGLEWVFTNYSKYPSGRFKKRVAVVLGEFLSFFFFFYFFCILFSPLKK